MTSRFTHGMFRGMTPAQAQDAEDFGDWGELLPDSLDARDMTPPPPAYLDPMWVRCMRARIKRFAETGVVDWLPPAQVSSTTQIERNSHDSHP